MTRRLGLVAPLAALGALLGPSAASAESPGDSVWVSPDGTTWSADLPAPLFDPAVRWVPGDARTSAFFVENRGATPAELQLQVTAEDVDGLVRQGDLQLAARVAGGLWTAVTRDAGSALDAIAVRVGETRRIEVRAAFRKAATNLSQASAVTLRFVVRLAEVTPVRPAPVPLPDTGAPAVRGPLFLAALCLGAGLALTRRRPGARDG